MARSLALNALLTTPVTTAPRHAIQGATRRAAHTQVARLDPEAERDRSAFNAAFHELGLRWQWDAATYDSLVGQPCERERLCRYLAREQAHLLRAYDAEFLIAAIEERKAKLGGRGAPARSATADSIDWAAFQAGEIGA